MTRFGPRWASPLRAAVAVSALAAAALAALFLAGVLSPGASAETGSSASTVPTPFSVNGMVAKIRVDYSEPCGPVRLGTSIGTGAVGAEQPTISLVHPTATATPGDVAGCFATGASPGFLRIDDELFGYSAIAVKTVTDIPNGTFTGAVTLAAIDGQNPADLANGFICSETCQAYIGAELVNYTMPQGSPFGITGRNLNSLPSAYLDHDPGSLVRRQGKLRLVARQQRTYRERETPFVAPTPTPAPHNWPAQVRSPVIQLTCRARLEQTSVSGLDPVTARMRCYAVLAPGVPWPDAPVPNEVILPLTPSFIHDLSTGTIDDKDTDGQTLTLTTDYLSFQCFPYIEGWLWAKITTAITLDTNFVAKDDDVGQFRVTLYTDACSTPLVSIPPLGQQDNLPAEGGLGATGIGTNFRARQAHDVTDTDGDGCPDKNELGDNVGTGGRRDPFNRWDYFNPANNATNRGPDISAVVVKFAQDKYLDPPTNTILNPDYDTKYDRGGVIPASVGPWSLLPANGTIRGPDITAAVQSFSHDCGTGINKAQTPTPKPTPTPTPT